MKRLLLILALVFLHPAIANAQSWSGTSTGDAFVNPPYRLCLGADNGGQDCFTQTGFLAARLSGQLDFQLTQRLVATLPSASLNSGRIFQVTDGQSSNDCTLGAGAISVICFSDGTAWNAVGSGSGGGGGAFPTPTAAGQVPFSTDNTIANVTWPTLPQCLTDGTQIGVFDPGNVSGFGPFLCIPNNRLNSVIQTPSISNGGNLIIPGDLSTPNLVFQQIPSQTQPYITFKDSSGNLLGYIDNAANAAFNSFVVLNSNPVSAWKYGSAPSGSAISGFVRLYVDSTAKVLCTNDDSGNNLCPITFPGIGTFTNKTYDTAGTGNVFKINGNAVSGIVGNTANVQMSGTHSNGTGATLCNDANNNTTDVGCAAPFNPVSGSQTGLTVTGTGNQLITLATPSTTGSYIVTVVPAITTQGSACTTYGSFDLHVGWNDGITGTTQTFDGSVIAIVAGSIVGSFSNQGVVVPIYATGGQPIQVGIKVTIASNTCTTSAQLTAKSEVTQ